MGDVGEVVTTHFKRTVCCRGEQSGGGVLREFRQKDMQDLAGVKGPATQSAIKALLDMQYMYLVRSDGPSKYYGITGDAAMALDSGI